MSHLPAESAEFLLFPVQMMQMSFHRHLLKPVLSVRKIQAAIQRLDEGTYGICEDCGEDISIPRLKARPVTKLCINCKARQEEGENIRGE